MIALLSIITLSLIYIIFFLTLYENKWLITYRNMNKNIFKTYQKRIKIYLRII